MGLAVGDSLATVLGFVLTTRAYGAASVAIIALAGALMLPNGRRAAAATALAYTLLLSLLFVFPFRHRKAFTRAVYEIRPGDSRAEVEQTLSAYSRGHPYASLFEERPSVSHWHPGRGGFNADHCVVRFDGGGRVGEVEMVFD